MRKVGVKKSHSWDADKGILRFITEAGMLKQVQRSGWCVAGIKDSESVADHSFRCAVIGYILAYMENAHPYKVLLLSIFNDLHEARITDLHKMAQRYIKLQKAEDRAFYEQVSSLPVNIRSELVRLRQEYRKQRTKESIIARDADLLECLIQAKEYSEQGFLEAVKLMKIAHRFLKTKSGRKLWRLAKNSNLNEWWSKLTEFSR